MSKQLVFFKSALFVVLFGIIVPQALYAQFRKVAPGKTFQFPRDHGAHYDYPVEWWYFTGHLKGEDRQTFGFELTFFRVAINPTERSTTSPWHVQSFYLSHAALTVDNTKQFFFEKRSRRPSFGRAGASDEKLRVWLDDWSVDQTEHPDGGFALQFNAQDKLSKEPFSLKLSLEASKAPVLQGADGYSQKGAAEEDASYYVSFTRLLGKGEITLQNQAVPVTASAWMDHEILSSQPNDEEVGWDWFAIQLGNDWECMLYHLRRGKQGSTSPYSAGGCVKPNGERIALTLNDYTIHPQGSWKSPRSGIRYPSGWMLSIPKLELELEVTPTVRGQELISSSGVSRSYWEGRNTVTGTQRGVAVTGSAYVELVGYSQE